MTDYLILAAITVVQKYVETPFSRIWGIYMAQGALIAEGRLSAPFVSGMIGVTRHVIKQDGYKGLFQSAGFKTVASLTEPYIHFASNSLVLLLFPTPKNNTDLLVLRIVASVVSTLATYPLSHIKYRMLMDSPAQSATDVVTATYKAEGIKGFYRGVGATMGAVVLYRGVYFSLHSLTQGAVSESNLFGRFAIGYGITVVAGLATFPIDVVRRRAMLRVGNERLRGGNAWPESWHSKITKPYP